jgi:N-hydroxyarylamine O-acetyltransferase
LNLDAYFLRIGYDGPRAPAHSVLEALHLAHATHIPFENLDILLGRPIRLDLASLEEKLVVGWRGGYCFEHNTLFAAVLEALGFQVTRLAARVKLGTTRMLPRTHMLLRVDLEGHAWLADVGFGAEGLLKPLAFRSGEAAQQFAWTYRVVQEAGWWTLQGNRGEDWQDFYTFTLEPHYPIDFEMANHYTSTHPESRFVQTLTAQLSTAEARYTLRNNDLVIDRGHSLTQHAVPDGEPLLQVLSRTFGLDFPAGTRFRVPARGTIDHVESNMAN